MAIAGHVGSRQAGKSSPRASLGQHGSSRRQPSRANRRARAADDSDLSRYALGYPYVPLHEPFKYPGDTLVA